MDRIPKIIHQIWIGPYSPPLTCMQTWRDKNPDFEYIFWNEQEFEKRGILFEAQEKIDMIGEYSGKTDIMRIEILSKYGGIFIDADSICIEPIGELFERFESSAGFATFENEIFRKRLIANGNFAVIPRYPLLRDMLDWILSPEANEPIRNLRSWGSVGPALLTRFLETGKYPGFMVLPSYYFLPIHFEGGVYTGHRKVYAHQLWGSNYNLYENTDLQTQLPEYLSMPSSKINIRIDFNNSNNSNSNNEITMESFLKQIHLLLESIKTQTGHFIIDIWIILENNSVFEEIYRELFRKFERTSRFISLKIKNGINEKINEKINENPNLENPEPYILIPPNCILYPDTIEKVISGNPISVPLYNNGIRYSSTIITIQTTTI